MMKTCIAMLRGINLGSHYKLSMAALKNLFEGLDFEQVETYVQSGNVIFEGPEAEPQNLEKTIKAKIEQVFGYQVPVIVRDSQDLQRILDNNPFITTRKEDPDKLHVTFLGAAANEIQWNKLTTPDNIPDEFIPGEQEIFVYCPNGYGRTKLTNNFFEKKLGIPATTRNWKTVQALQKIAQARND